ncbi:MAG: hypothetical protein KA764_10605 [Anaerolineales bacterium]|nr:hypothetical protein [Anaerolineales bacterium]
MSSTFSSLELSEALVAELHRLGVRHLVRLHPDRPASPIPPADLIAALARHPEARMRGALIPLFLRRPSFSQYVPAIQAGLTGAAADTLRLYYQAAVYLRSEVAADLRQFSDDGAALPDLFSEILGVPAPGAVPAASALEALGAVHARLTGRAYNWVGTYRQSLPVFLRQLRQSHAALSA